MTTFGESAASENKNLKINFCGQNFAELVWAFNLMGQAR
jgi:hypothetical protein